ncbi:MAG: 30S ribosomal protein S8 [candidate division TM6 bacterium GW2011_GWF2_37_49]|nr:MAG: 30S ribosomal protein S8 [candidate division TM6 bacterium GW2011_GWF2_37_49]
MSIDTISDFLTIIRNGLSVSKKSIVVPYSNFKTEITKVLNDEGYISDYKEQEIEGKRFLVIFLKYVNGESVIHEIKRISTPGRRRYEAAKVVAPVIGGLGISILTTSFGVVTDRKAKELGVGGEVVCNVW